MTPEYHPVVNKITSLLSERGMWFETFEHEPVRTSEEAAAVRTGYGIEHGAKALLVRVKHREQGKMFAMFVLPANARFDSAQVKKQFNFTDLRFATEAEVAEITGGVLPGGVPPFGNLFNLPVFADNTLFLRERIIFNAGDRRFSVAMRAEDYRTLVSPTLAHFALSE